MTVKEDLSNMFGKMVSVRKKPEASAPAVAEQRAVAEGQKISDGRGRKWSGRTELLSARVSGETRAQIYEGAAASGVTIGKFIEDAVAMLVADRQRKQNKGV